MRSPAEFDFDYWAQLARTDPEGFEAERQRCIRAVIDESSENSRRRLEGLQFQLDLERERAKTPMGACLRLSEMMMNLLHEQLLPRLNQLANGTLQAVEEDVRQRPKARVLPFRPSAPKDDASPE